MRRVAVACTFLLLAVNSGAQQLFTKSTPTGKMQLVVGNSDLPFLTNNFLKTGASYELNNNPPTILSADGYPTTAPLTQEIDTFMQVPPQCTTAAPCVIGWSGTGGLQSSTNNLVVTSDPQSCALTANPVRYLSGTNCAVTFHWNTQPATSNLDISFPFATQGGHTFTYSGMSGAYLIRQSDQTAYTSCAAGNLINCFTPEYLQVYGALNPLAIRTLGLTLPQQNQTLENQAQWKYRTRTTAFSYNVPQFPPSIWAGSASGTDQYTVGSYTDMPAQLTDGEEFQASFASAGSSFPRMNGGTPTSNGGLVEIPISAANGTLTSASIASNSLSGTVSGTILPGMYINDGTDAAGTCVIVSGTSSPFTTSGCSNVGPLTITTYTPIANAQTVLVANIPGATGGWAATYSTTGLTFSGCNAAAPADRKSVV